MMPASLILRLALLVAASLAIAGDFDIRWYTIDSGGGDSQHFDGWRVQGAVGRPDADAFMTAGGWELTGGFVAGLRPSLCLGDTDGNDVVDLIDLSYVLANFGTTSGAHRWDGDVEPHLEGDGDVDLTDLTVVLARFGEFCSR